MEPSDPYNSYSFRYKIHLYLLPFTKVNANNPAIKKSRKAVALIIFGRDSQTGRRLSIDFGDVAFVVFKSPKAT